MRDGGRHSRRRPRVPAQDRGTGMPRAQGSTGSGRSVIADRIQALKRE